jgi:hypothetical protein
MKHFNLNCVGAEAMAQADDEIKRTLLVVVKGTMTIHAVFWTNTSTVTTRKMSGFCNKCFPDG